jgi:hypothetical protein
VELSLDLRFTPPDKVLSRLFGALDRVGADVTLLVLLRDTPEYAGVVASAYQALRARGYVSDSSRFPPGGQRLRVRRRADRAAPVLEPGLEAGLEPGDGAGSGPSPADEPNGTPSGGPFKSEP